jgi:serine/threonine-protein kinase
MRSFLKIGGLLGLFVIVAGIAGYFTLKFIVKSKDVVIVPDLEGKDVVYALELLTDLGLNTKVAGYEFRTDIPKNYVAYQDPRAGAEVKKDRDIRVIVSKGPQTVVVPNLVGIDLREANIIVEENGLARGIMSETFAKGPPRGEVIGQVPMPGRVVDKGNPVDLLVSLGARPQRFKMPHLDRLSPEDAIVFLERSQLNLGQIRYVQRKDVPQDVVVGQNPRSGYPVDSGTMVHITVNRREKVRVQDKGLFFFHHPVPYGFLKKRIRLRLSVFGVLYDLFDHFWVPGEDLWVLLPRHDEGIFFLYEDDELVLTRSIGLEYPHSPLATVAAEKL